MHPDKENTEVLYGNDNIIKKTLETFSWIERTLEDCINHTELAMHVTTPMIWDGLNELKERGVKLRLVTEITVDNISYAKKMMEIAEVRHLRGVRSSFGIADGIEYLDHAISEQDQLSHAIISNVKAIVDAKKYLFETLWNIASPAEQATREIEEGIEPTKTEIIQDTKVSISRASDIIKSAKEQVLVSWATSKTFVIGMNAGINKIYSDAIRNGATVKLLVPYGDRIEIRVKDLKMLVPEIDIKIADMSLQTKITILIVDRKEVMTWELRDDNIENPYEAGGLATYSNNKSIASSYATIFETFWKQTELYEQSKNFNKMQNDFINIAAHELRTPIQPILGLSQILQSKIKNDHNSNSTEYQELLDTIVRNAKRLRQLTEDILDVTRIDNQSLQLKKELLSVNEVILSVLSDYGIISNSNSNKRIIKKVHDENKIKINFSSKDDIFVMADRSRLYQVFANLLNNAIKFTTEGIIDIIVLIHRNKQAIVIVRDTGVGIDPEILPRLFSKFATKSETSGTGLGLYISKGIVEAHGGRMWADNNKDDQKGATFYFSLPLNQL
ncbi:MAG: HAMP domain-containing histidine kinase [Nitrososphaeraceae archaeon]|nr:HAMP domain-containing histidine kinase [Nitrososphaeraceae archaeon]